MSDRRHLALTGLRLVLASLAVGLVLSFLGITPADLLDRISGLFVGLWDMLTTALGWAGSYILLGALVVVPVWLLLLAWRRLGRG